MAPQTRRSMGLNKAAANTNTGMPAADATSQFALVASPASVPPKRGRGRLAKTSIIGSIDSASSAPTPTTTVSDSEYSTPATSNAVTPAPSTDASTKPASSRSRATSTRRAHLVVELPDIVQYAAGAQPKAQEFGIVASSTSKRPRRGPISYAEDSDEDDELFGHDQSASAVLARKLQREEDNWQVTPSFTSRLPARRTTRTASSPVDLSRDDSEDDVLSTSRPSKRKARPSKRKALEASTINAIHTDSDPEKDDDEPLSSTAPARKKLKKSEEGLIARELAALPDLRAELQSLTSQDSDADFANVEVTDDDDDEVELSGDGHQDPNQDVPEDGDNDSDVQLQLGPGRANLTRGARKARERLEFNHPELKSMWINLKKRPVLKAGKAEQPTTISRLLKPFQLEGLAWMKAMEGMDWKGGLLGDEMGLGKTIQAVSLIMSDYPAKVPSLVLVPPVALMQWTAEIGSYTGGTLKTLVYHGTNTKAKHLSLKELKKFDVILMSYNSLEAMYRRQEKGLKRKDGMYKEKSVMHQIKFHRVILDEAHYIKTRGTMTAKACFALKADYRWCLSGTPLQNRIGEFFSLIRFLNVAPFASYFCKQCDCSSLEWSMNDVGSCTHCNHYAMGHISVFNQELLNPIQKYGNSGAGKNAFKKLRLLTDRIMLRRLKKDHTDSMELPVKEIYVDRQFFGEEENDFAHSIMSNGQRKFDTYVAQGVLLNNYANIFGLIMQMRQVADHPDLILRKSGEGGQNVLVCCICDEPAEQAIRSKCKHEFCRPCAKSYVNSQGQPDCPQCHIPLSIDLEQPDIEQDEAMVKKSSIINRIKMENWTSSSKIELLVHELHKLRSDNASHKSIIFSQFTTMLQLIEWRLRRAGITTVMLDGTMTPAQRQASINHFMTNVDVECFLVSLKAGGVALNLTEASRVFIVDPWWNPAAEWQSADRCHRIGQTRPCTITRLCIEDSVESRMVLLQEKKTSMIHSTINSDDAAMDSLSTEDLQFLFRGN
ncbi:Uu.00g089670.m01.CDS01 [Anthostomella pinea]|uniref:Uu.00g089670.m01.CDS01 n=1 Tax=Anthostomella pinea TaxID=933095 RepID=A0AAI8VNN9_9PEZI|nr:Uu.00g089670.m01.CDS01 [Anthostomella pinea]